MPLANATPFAAVDVPLLGPDGREMVAVVVKSTWRVLGPGRVVLDEEDPAPVRMADALRDSKDEKSPRRSARYPSDVCLAKRGTDLLVVGEAVAPRPARVVDVAVRARERTLALRVHGIREYFRMLFEVAVSASVPFERMPIAWERAYGGGSDDGSLVEDRNPAGVGVARRDADLVGTLAPQIEHPSRPHKSSKDRHAPVGLGPILPHWSPRRERAGTFDEAWRATRAPLLPSDFDVGHNNVAPEGLVFDPPLAPGDPISITGMSHEPFEVLVPAMPLVVRARRDGAAEELRPLVDTIIVEPGRGRIELVARVPLLMGRGKSALREVRVDLDG